MAIERFHTLRAPSRASAWVQYFARDCQGSVAIEYILAGALIGVGVLAGVSLLSDSVAGLYGSVIAKFG